MTFRKHILCLFFISLTCTAFAQEEESVNKYPEEVFKVVEEMPRFPGCEMDENDYDYDRHEVKECSKKAMMDYLYSNLQYPEAAMKNKTEGMAVVMFIVRPDSLITDIDLIRDPGDGTGEEAVRLVESMNDMPLKWRPGKQRGRAVNVRYTLPVRFRIED